MASSLFSAIYIVFTLPLTGLFWTPPLLAAAAPPGRPIYRIVYNPAAHPPFRLIAVGATPGTAAAAAPGGPAPQGGPEGINPVSVSIFDPVNNAIRINALLTPGGTHTPGNADQIFTSIFDPVNNAVRVNCVLGCGGGGVTFGTDLAAIDSTHQKVIGFNGIQLASGTPANNQVYLFSSSLTQWVPSAINFSILSGQAATTQVPNLPESQITNLSTDLAAKEVTANKNQASGYAGLNAGSQIATTQVPNLPESQITNLSTDLAAKEVTANKNQASGYAGLNASSQIATTQVPNLPESQITNLSSDLAAKEVTANKNQASGYAGLSASSQIAATQVPNLPESQITNLSSDLAAKEVTANKNQASGYAGLNASSQIATTQVPNLPESQITNLSSDLAAKEVTANKNQASGYAGLNASSQIATTQVPNLPESQITNLSSDLAAKEVTANKNQASGYAGLSASSQIAATQVPNLPESQITNLSSDLAAKEVTANKNQPSGYAGLNASSQIAATEMPLFGASGASHAAGAVPDPGSTAGATRFLREDQSWAVPAGGGTIGGTNTAVQFNNSSALGGDAPNFAYNSTTHALAVTGAMSAASYTVGGAAGGLWSPNGSTSGTATVQPAAVAGGTLTLPNTTGNVMVTSQYGSCAPFDTAICSSSVDASGNPNFLAAGSGAAINVNGGTTPIVLFIAGYYQTISSNLSVTAVTSVTNSAVNYVIAKQDAANGNTALVTGDLVTANTAPIYAYTAPTCPSPTPALSATNVAYWFNLATNQSELCTSNAGSYSAVAAIVLGEADVTTAPVVDFLLAEPWRLNPYRRFEMFGDGSNNAENLTANATVDGYKQYTSLSVNGATLQHSPEVLTTTPTPGLILYSQNPVMIIAGGAVNVNGLGSAGLAGTTGVGATGNGGSCGGGGGGGGAAGITNGGGAGGGRTTFGSTVGAGTAGAGSAGIVPSGAGNSTTVPLAAGVSGNPDPHVDVYVMCFGASGGAGGGDTTSSAAGGNSGAGGGAIYIKAPSILVSATSSVTANGNMGLQGNVISGSSNDCSGSGGGGGAGSATLAGGFITQNGTLTATGGAGGTATTGCLANGGAGGAGGSGIALMQKLW